MAASFWEAIVNWVASAASAANKKANIASDAQLKKFDCSLSWADPNVINSAGRPASAEIRTSVIAESDRRAREMSQERAIKEDPLVTGGAISSNKIVPPYMTDPAGTLRKWQVAPGELDDEERDRAKKGILGPEAVVFYSLTPAVA
jgi:hypothetical protein